MVPPCTGLTPYRIGNGLHSILGRFKLGLGTIQACKAQGGRPTHPRGENSNFAIVVRVYELDLRGNSRVTEAFFVTILNMIFVCTYYPEVHSAMVLFCFFLLLM